MLPQRDNKERQSYSANGPWTAETSNEDDDGEYVEDGGDDVDIADDVEKPRVLP